MNDFRITVDCTTWDAEYASGRWDYLANEIERSRYDAIAREIMRVDAQGDVLDLGCGQALLLDALYRYDFSGTYRGVDWSLKALDIARLRHADRFEHADLNVFVPSRAVDVIVLSEVLYYLADPLRLVAVAVSAVLERQGCVLVSIYQPRAKARLDDAVLLTSLYRQLISHFPIDFLHQIRHKEYKRSWSFMRISARDCRKMFKME